MEKVKKKKKRYIHLCSAGVKQQEGLGPTDFKCHNPQQYIMGKKVILAYMEIYTSVGGFVSRTARHIFSSNTLWDKAFGAVFIKGLMLFI